ncbi:hypothetical protein F4780DRAFT_557118 [Xylariomycetidae sp. FL0641]|nr:hypothetical protein F4780DRAFT_557118 [Xylariomycetidae sp. FL0641]
MSSSQAATGQSANEGIPLDSSSDNETPEDPKLKGIVSSLALEQGIIARAQVLCGRYCRVKHLRFPDQTRLPTPLRDWPDLQGLHSLSFSRRQWANDVTLSMTLQAYRRGLPKALEDKIEAYAFPLEKCFNSDKEGQARFNQMQEPSYRRIRREFRKYEYTIWALTLNNVHWVSAVIHKEQRLPSDSAKNAKDKKDTGRFTHVAQIAILDPMKSAQSIQLVQSRLKVILTSWMGCTLAEKSQREIWVPQQHDTVSCGPRAFWAAKQTMDRLLVLHEASQTYNESLWEPQSGWFDEDFVRWQMIGLCAWEIVRAMDYRARVAIELVHDVKVDKANQSTDAGFHMRPPDHGPDSQNWPKPQIRPSNLAPARVNANAALATKGHQPKVAPKTPKRPIPSFEIDGFEEIVAPKRPQKPKDQGPEFSSPTANQKGNPSAPPFLTVGPRWTGLGTPSKTLPQGNSESGPSFAVKRTLFSNRAQNVQGKQKRKNEEPGNNKKKQQKQ